MKRKIQDILQQKPWLGYAFMLAIGLLLGFVFFSNSSKKEGHQHTEAGKEQPHYPSVCAHYRSVLLAFARHLLAKTIR